MTTNPPTEPTTQRKERYRYEIVSSDYDYDCLSLWFNHKHLGWVTMPKQEVKFFTKSIKATRVFNREVEI